MKVNEIFISIEGEGVRTGLPVVFIRLHGCNLNCSYCDTRYACEGKDYVEMSAQEICEKVKIFKCKNITLTGGEPLIHDNVYSLIKLLSEKGYMINIETNGTVEINRAISYENVIVTLDHKSISSNMSSYMMLEKNQQYLRVGDVIKFVVSTDEDIKQVEKVIKEYDLKCYKYVSPIFNKIDAVTLVEKVLDSDILRENDIRVQIQLHKIIWDPNKRGV